LLELLINRGLFQKLHYLKGLGCGKKTLKIFATISPHRLLCRKGVSKIAELWPTSRQPEMVFGVWTILGQS